MKKFSVLTLFPELIGYWSSISVIGKAVKRKAISVEAVDIREFALDKHKTVDDRPCGGGRGMILRVDVIDRAISNLKIKRNCRLILLDPKGKLLNQKKVERLSKYEHLVLVAGHYEGVDHRVHKIVDEAISVGDYVLTGGELPAMTLIDALTRLAPGGLGKAESSTIESFTIKDEETKKRLLEYPQYTRPVVYTTLKKKTVLKVPSVLLTGNHQKISSWRMAKSRAATARRETKKH